MAIIDKHILDIVNNKDSIEAFYTNYLGHDEDWNDYLDEIENDRPLFPAQGGYRYDYNMFKDEIILEIFGDRIKEQFYNNIIRALVDDITDDDKHIMFNYLISERKKLFFADCKELYNLYNEDNWYHIIMYYVEQKVENMIVNERGWLHNDVKCAIEDYACGKIQERISRKIAIEKIKRNKIFNLGLGLKLSMQNCGILLEA